MFGLKTANRELKTKLTKPFIPGVAGTRWAMLNAVTELVDHERGRSNNTRIESAWFGTGAALKNKALELLSA
jgi:hypothetical protein